MISDLSDYRNPIVTAIGRQEVAVSGPDHCSPSGKRYRPKSFDSQFTLYHCGQSATSCSATRIAFATMVRVGFTLPLVGSKEESQTTTRLLPQSRP